MPKQSKRDKRVVVNEMYFNALEKRSQLLIELTTDCNGEFDGQVHVSADLLKNIAKAQKEWDKQEIEYLAGSGPYVEPKA